MIMELFIKFISNIDASINALLSPISNKIAGTVFWSFSFLGADIRIIVLWLIAGAIFCTFYFNKCSMLLSICILFAE